MQRYYKKRHPANFPLPIRPIFSNPLFLLTSMKQAQLQNEFEKLFELFVRPTLGTL
jgi:hypothetical protein